MTRLLALIVVGLLAGCMGLGREGDRAAVESRPADVRTQGQAPARAADNRSVVAGIRPGDVSMDANEMRRTIEKQARRIAELESRAAADAESRQVLDLVAYAQRLNGLRSDEQGHELTVANQDFARDPGPYSRLRLALVLSAPGTAFNDDARAASLLDPLSAQSGKGPLRQFAVLVHGLLSERLREQKRVAQLKEQINGLRAIDRALIERDQGRAP